MRTALHRWPQAIAGSDPPQGLEVMKMTKSALSKQRGGENATVRLGAPWRGRKIIVSLLAVGMAAVAGCGGGNTGPHTMSGNRIFEQNRPATVMIYAEFSASPKLVRPVLTDSAIKKLVDKVVTEESRGTIGTDTASFDNAAVEELSANIFDYFTPSNDPGDFLLEPKGFTQSFIGSGFIVTADGYVITNAHVAAPGDDVLKDGFSVPFAQEVAAYELNAWFKVMNDLTDKTLKDFSAAFAEYAYKKMDMGKTAASFTAVLGVAASGGDTANKGIRLDLVMAGDPAYVGSQKDVAIFKMEGKNNLPTVDIGDDTALQTGDHLYVLGYPKVATINDFLKPGQTFEPSFTTGQVSGKKTMQGGWSAIQTDASITHGNSGGPVFNDKGQVIGIATFGSIDEQGNEIQGFNFLVPTSILKEYLQKAGVKPGESQTTKLYSLGLDAYDGGHYKIAVTYFTQADNLFAGDEEILSWKQNSAQKVQSGADSTPFFYCWINACPSGS
ncbi:MAG: trypsin-like serine protease [Chloroflexi bacterium]|nr:MAG: trypsin-like serine protease [Chloroflexota bacterium]TME24292.1 MAG: trypsin-like serine protease [Chloroflexota bacterium]